jgi:hypothetical protein
VTGQTVVDFWEVSEAVEFAEKTNPRAHDIASARIVRLMDDLFAIASPW